MSKLTNTHTFTALVTPFTKSGAIDYSSLDLLIEEQESANNGIILLGSTGEGLALTSQEKLSLLQHVCRHHLSIPVLSGVSGFLLNETIHWLEVCETLPIDGYLMVTPIYSRPGPQGQINWFRKLLDNVSKPCMLYNVPSRAGSSLAIEVLKELQNHSNLWALKEASGSLDHFRAYRNAAPNLSLFSGNDDIMPELAHEGAVGLVSVMGNCWPKATNHYVQRSLEKNMLEDHSLSSAIRSVNKNNPVSVKTVLYALNKIKNLKLRAPLSEKDGTPSKELIEHYNNVSLWLETQKKEYYISNNME